MMTMTIEQVRTAVEGRPAGVTEVPLSQTITSVVTDSRQVRAGSLFVAIAGEHVDGHDYLQAAADRGAVAALVEHEVAPAGLVQILVKNTVEALGELAKANIAMRRATNEPFSIIGITGSVGKTTTKDLLAALLSDLGPTIAPIGSFNNEIGLPLTALTVDDHTRFLIAEMGANHLGEIAHLTTIAPPDVAVVLKVGVAHLGEFGSVAHIAQAKSEIVRGILQDGTTILNADDARVAAMSEIAPGKVMWFGIDHAQVHDDAQYLAADDISVNNDGRPVFTIVDEAGVEQRVELGIPGKHNVMNALAAASVARLAGMPLARIAHVLSNTHAISAHRMAVSEVHEGDTRFTLIDDSFNANPDSMRAGIDGLLAWHAQDAQPYRVAVLGAMLELGGDEEEAHRGVGAYAREHGVDAIIAVGGADEHLQKLAHALAEGAGIADAPQSVFCVQTIEEADKTVRDLNKEHPDMVVLLKGSHASGLSDLATRWAATKQD